MMAEAKAKEIVNLPPGFCFCPTDEELILHFLYRKASDLLPCYPNIIPDLDLSLLHPWELYGKALASGNQYYFFTKVKENRITESGYWKEIGICESIVSAADKKLVGMKKYLVFHIGQEPQGTETSWVMQEYHLSSYAHFSSTSCNYKSTRGRGQSDQSNRKWVLCRVYERVNINGDPEQGVLCNGDGDDDDNDDDSGTELSWLDEVFLSLDDDDLEEIISLPN